MKYIVERIEENIASLESFDTGEIISLNVLEIPFKIIEGDVLAINEEECYLLEEEKIERQNNIKNKMESIWEDE